jgi:hypothetical protein
VRLRLKPNEIVTMNLIYYKFLLDDRTQDFGLTRSRVNHSRRTRSTSSPTSR